MVRMTRARGPWRADFRLDDRVRVADRELPRTLDVWSDNTGDAPGVRLTFVLVGDGYECRQITFTAPKGGREVRSVDLRALHIEDVLETAVTMVGTIITDDRADGVTVSVPITNPGEAREAVSAVRAGRRAARQKLSEDMLQQVATTYRDNVADQPTEAVADRFGVAARTARLYVRRARDAGFLGAAVPGRAGEQ
jgi:hypothetical protein